MLLIALCPENKAVTAAKFYFSCNSNTLNFQLHFIDLASRINKPFLSFSKPERAIDTVLQGVGDWIRQLLGDFQAFKIP